MLDHCWRKLIFNFKLNFINAYHIIISLFYEVEATVCFSNYQNLATVYDLSFGSNLHHLRFRTDGCRIPTLSSSAIFGSTDWLVISVVGGGILVKNTESSVSNPWCSPQYSLQFWPWPVFFASGTLSSVGTFFCVLWLVVLYLAAQCRNPAHYSPCTFLFLHALPTPFHLWAVGCPHPSALFECMASMWCLHLPLLNLVPVWALSRWGRLLHQHC